MKYWSELLQDKFDTEALLNQAEANYLNEVAAREEAAKKKAEELKAVENTVSKQKKELAKAVESASEKLNTAYAELEIAKTKAAEVMKKAQEDSAKIMADAKNEYDTLVNTAKVNVEDAYRDRLEAIQKFNEKFGAYTTTLTGDRAVQEYRRLNSWLDSYLGDFDAFMKKLF